MKNAMRKVHRGEMVSIETMLGHIVRESASSLQHLLSQEPVNIRERVICVDLTERLQRCSEQYIVINERPYSDGSAKDALADLWFCSREADSPRLWVEVKPMAYGWNYWNFSKFFNGASESSEALYLADSVILNDVDKLNLVLTENAEYEQGFAFVLLLRLGEDTLEPDPTPPQPGKSLTIGQVLYMVEKRMQHNLSSLQTIHKRHARIPGCRKHGAFEVFSFAAML